MFCRLVRRSAVSPIAKYSMRFATTMGSMSCFDSSDPISKSEFRHLMDQCKMNPYSRKKWIVAVSGGPDSMALLSLMKEWTNKDQLVAVTVDHGFREESGKEAAQVHEWISSMNIQHITKRIEWTSFPTPTQMEKEGRIKRYQCIQEVCKQFNTSDVVVAHHGDDQIETFLMRLYRGSGYAGLACMRSIQEMEDGTRRIRPFLHISKQRLLATCEKESTPYVIDPSNHDLQYDRNRVRFGVSQIREGKWMNIQSILNVIDYFQIIRDAEESVLQDVFISCCEYNRELGIVRVNSSILSTEPLVVIAAVIKRACFGIGGSLNPSENAIQRISQSIQEHKGIKKPMQVAGCVLSELKFGSSVYTKRNKNVNWICICIDRNQLLAKNVHLKAVPLPLNQEIRYLNQYTICVKEICQKTEALVTMSPLPLIQQLLPSTPLSVSFIPDSMIQSFLCSNRGILTRRNLSNLIARSIPGIFATINGKPELIYSTVFKVNRVGNFTCSIKAVPKPIFRDVASWVIH